MKRIQAKDIALDAWLMLPNDCKVIMKDLKDDYIKSLEASINHAIKESYDVGFSIGID